MEEKGERRYVCCPICGRETDILIGKDTMLYYFPLDCMRCGKQTIVSVVNFKIAVHDGEKTTCID